ncbi:hypothetical protein DN511_31365, partial [Burkholderia multivorans]|uniref:hypothetical protein n=1 Tax=Burkholderia multivorans TaxID=87883 RepID=UPI000DB04FB4
TPKQLFDGPTVAELARVAKIAAAGTSQPAAEPASSVGAEIRTLTPAHVERDRLVPVAAIRHVEREEAVLRGPFDA